MELESLKYIGMGFMSIAMFGAATSIGNIFAALLNSIARNPSSESALSKNAYIGAALAEAMGLFAFLIVLLLLFL